MGKKKQQQKQKRKAKARRDEPVMRLAHEILVKKIDPADLTLEEAVDVLACVAKGIVLSNTDDDDPEDRSGMIAWIEDRFITAMADIDPNPKVDHPHVWFIPPQGLITEPFGITWSGVHDEDSVRTLIGTELASLREEISKLDDHVHVHVIEGVQGVAMVDPDWDGSPTVPCANPQCDNTHDVHLLVAEKLFELTKREGASHAAPN